MWSVTYLPLGSHEWTMTTDERDESLAGVDALEEADRAALEASLTASDPTERQRAARAVERLAASDADRATELVDDLLPLLEDESVAVVRAAAEALVPIANARPEPLCADLDRLVELVAFDTAAIALAGAGILVPVAVEQPEAVAAHVGRLLEILDDGEVPAGADELPDSVDLAATREAIRNVVAEERERQRYVRETVANVVVAAAEADPTCLASEVDLLERRLADSNPVVVGGAVDALGLLGEIDTDAVAPARASLLACLDHDAPTVRARTVRTLGLIGDRESIERVSEVAETDPDEDVRALAAETAAFLAD